MARTFVEQNYLDALVEYFNGLEGYNYQGIGAGDWSIENVAFAIKENGEATSIKNHLVLYGRRPEITNKLFAQDGFEDGYLDGLAAYYNDVGYTLGDIDVGGWSAEEALTAVENSGETVESHFLKYARRPAILDSVDSENAVARDPVAQNIDEGLMSEEEVSLVGIADGNSTGDFTLIG